MEKELYDDMYRQEQTHWWFQARREIITDIVRVAAPPNVAAAKPKLLDVGCGTGFILERLRAWYDVYGLDHAEVAVEYCKQKSLLNVRQGVLGAEDFGTQFDLILFLDIIEHINDDLDVLRKAHLYLKERGQVIVTVPAYKFLWSRHDEIHHHRRRYTKASLKTLLTRAGYEPVFISYYDMILFPAVFVVRKLGKLFGRRNASDTWHPGKRINQLLYTLFSLERKLLPKITLPFGVSLLCLAKRAAIRTEETLPPDFATISETTVAA